MKTTTRAALLALLLAPISTLPACRGSGGDADDGGPPTDAGPDLGPADDLGADDLGADDLGADDLGARDLGPDDLGPPVDAAPPPPAALRFVPVAPNNMGNQLHVLYQRLGATDSQRGKGWFYVELCDAPACPDPTLIPINDEQFGPYPSVNGPGGDALELGGLTGRAAPYYARFFLDTAYSRSVDAGVDAEGGAGNFDVYASGGALDGATCQSVDDCVEGAIVDGRNPDPLTFELTLTAGETLDLGRVVFGHLVADIETPQPAPGDGVVLVAASGTGGRNAVYAIDERDQRVDDGDLATLDGARFEGDFCGFVRGEGDDLWVLGFSARDGHVFRYDTAARAFVDQPALTVPAPAGNDARVSLCRGVWLAAGERRYLVLIELQGAGALDSAEAYPMAIVDVTDPAAPVATPIAVGEGPFEGDPPAVSPVLRGVATDGVHVFAVAPSWRAGGDGESALYSFAIDPETGAPSLLHTVAAGVADDRCSSTLHFVPALAAAEMGGAARVFVGTDAALDIYDAAALAAAEAEGPIGSIDTTAYGTLPTTLSTDPAGERLYVMPNCKSADRAMLDGFPANRHAVAIVDLQSDPATPTLLHTERRFDDPDGGPTGGIDLAFLSLKRQVLRWYRDAVLPPVAYTGPQIAVGTTALYLRGAGISLDNDAPDELRAAGVSGLGQAGDIGVMDLATGEGTLSRPDYSVWFDGPSAEWGLKLREAGVAGASTGALIWVPGE